MSKINRRNGYYDCGIFFECYVMDDFGNLVRVPVEAIMDRGAA